MTLEEWRVPADIRLRWRFWDGEFLVFNDSSGNTHLLDALAGEVLRYLGQPATANEILRHLSADLRLSEDEIPASRIEDVLSFLRSAELIERVPS